MAESEGAAGVLEEKVTPGNLHVINTSLDSLILQKLYAMNDYCGQISEEEKRAKEGGMKLARLRYLQCRTPSTFPSISLDSKEISSVSKRNQNILKDIDSERKSMNNKVDDFFKESVHLIEQRLAKKDEIEKLTENIEKFQLTKRNVLTAQTSQISPG